MQFPPETDDKGVEKNHEGNDGGSPDFGPGFSIDDVHANDSYPNQGNERSRETAHAGAWVGMVGFSSHCSRLNSALAASGMRKSVSCTSWSRLMSQGKCLVAQTTNGRRCRSNSAMNAGSDWCSTASVLHLSSTALALATVLIWTPPV